MIAFEVSSITLALEAKLAHEPPVAPAAPIPVIEYTAPAPGVTVLAESVGGALVTVTVLVSPAVLLALVETAKLKLPLGAFASNTTCTLAPAAMPELQLIVNVSPLVVATAPVVWRHVPERRYALVGAKPRAAEESTVIVAPDPSAAGVVKLTVQLVGAPVTTLVGETAAPVTAPVGVPMV